MAHQLEATQTTAAAVAAAATRTLELFRVTMGSICSFTT